MSSPKAAGRKSPPSKNAKPAARGARPELPASDAGMSGQDKAVFIKAMMEGVPVKGAAGSAPKKRAAPAKPKTVEILRKISAPSRMEAPSNPASDQARAFAAMLEAKHAASEFDVLTPEATQELMAALCKLYAANMEAGNKYPVVRDRFAIASTDAMILCGALLKAVDLQVFELGMWQSWSGV